MKQGLNNKHLIIGMIHLPATLSYKDWPGLKAFIAKAKKDLHSLEIGGVSAALIENDGDSPCQIRGTADVVAPMTIVAYELAKTTTIPLGIEVLLNDPQASLSIAKTCGLSFIRTDYFVDQMTRPKYGQFEINPVKLLEYRQLISANHIKIYADIQVKYATMIDKNKTIKTSAIEAMKAGADGIIVTGSKTGEKPIEADIEISKKVVGGKIPVIVGSGFSFQNSAQLLKYADGAIVGTSIKTGDYIDVKKAKALMAQVRH